MRRYKLDGIEVSADSYIDFLKVGVKQLQAENEVINEENKELRAILSFKNDVADSMNQYKMKYEDALFEIDKLKEENEKLKKSFWDVAEAYNDLLEDYINVRIKLDDIID